MKKTYLKITLHFLVVYNLLICLESECQLPIGSSLSIWTPFPVLNCYLPDRPSRRYLLSCRASLVFPVDPADLEDLQWKVSKLVVKSNLKVASLVAH